ncbi:iron transporter [Conexibacter sp. DBS9H8]|uniref:iron transporter n=1 Tax=Conexibacter sp. DBS9H8 TaxID=2937801 RepID=UPI00200E63AB|nr:iron transporter [Conexibacter sp. DBS9H8]
MKRPLLLAATSLAVVAISGCAAANKNAADPTSVTAPAGASATAGAGSAVGSSGAGMSGMNMHTTTVLNAHGVPTPVPIKVLGSGDWKDMKITAEEMTPVPFYVYNGTSFSEEKPARNASFHLMVMLNDRHTGVAIPYATVWATIKKGSQTIFNQRQWPMISEYMGPHYGDNVTLPGPGTYRLTVLVSAPVAALHVEYAHMWTGTHQLTTTFTWK